MAELPSTIVGMTDSDSKNPVAIMIPFVILELSMILCAVWEYFCHMPRSQLQAVSMISNN
jgi:hypothetical protein